jgi:N-hydroxyarylamine O-acetyltransferase
MCEELQVSPASPFVTDWLCSRIDGDGGVTLFGHEFIDTRGGERIERTLDDEELPAVLERDFGVRARLVDGRWERVPTGVG